MTRFDETGDTVPPSAAPSEASWRGWVAISVVAGALGLASFAKASGAGSSATAPPEASRGDAIRPFRVHVPEKAVSDLKRRIRETRWPDKETVADASQGAPLARLQELVRYWGTSYDWRKLEAKLNALPQFTTNIDG